MAATGAVRAGEHTRRGVLRLTLSGAAVPWLAACGLLKGPPKPPPPTRLAGSLIGTADLNPSASDRPSPLRLRLYELRTVAAFQQADFMALYQQDQTTLGADLLGREEIVLNPGETRPYALKVLNAETRFLGVVALYRDLEHATWRAFAPVVPSRTHALTLQAQRLAVVLTLA